MDMRSAVQQPRVSPASLAGTVTSGRQNLPTTLQHVSVSRFSQNLQKKAEAESSREPIAAAKQQGEADLAVAVCHPGNPATGEIQSEEAGLNREPVALNNNSSLELQLAMFVSAAVVTAPVKTRPLGNLPGFTDAETAPAKRSKPASGITVEEERNQQLISTAASVGRNEAGKSISGEKGLAQAPPVTFMSRQNEILKPIAEVAVLSGGPFQCEVSGVGELSGMGVDLGTSGRQGPENTPATSPVQLNGTIQPLSKEQLASQQIAQEYRFAVEEVTVGARMSLKIGNEQTAAAVNAGRPAAEKVSARPEVWNEEMRVSLNTGGVTGAARTQLLHEMIDSNLSMFESDDGLNDAPTLVGSFRNKVRAKASNEAGEADAMNDTVSVAGRISERAAEVRSQPEAKPISAGRELRESILAQVNESIASYHGKDIGQVTIKLNPVELGALKINVQVENRVVKVEITAENQMVKDVLMGQLDTLKEVLLKQNLSVERFNVSAGEGYGFSQAFSEGKQPSQTWQQAAPSNVSGRLEAGEEVSSAHWRGREDALVDLRL